MSETCIVCLGNLDAGNALPPGKCSRSPTPSEASANPKKLASADQNHDKTELIAHLIPCGHNLHDECLKPWVERANSCPICRQNFNTVELCSEVGGSTISSYAVKDRVQVAEIDPSMIYEDDELDELLMEGCLICEEDNDEDHLLLCDGCDAACHTYCAGLDSVPAGAWFCYECSEHRAQTPFLRPTNSHRLPDRRTRGQQRRHRDIEIVNHGGWARVWQSVWDRLNLDLDFPYGDDQEISDYHRSRPSDQVSNYRFRDWERRAEVAERQGSGQRFRESTVMMFNNHPVREKPRLPQPESQEEIRAWNAFEKAKEIQDSGPKKRKKPKSTTASPSDREQPQEPVRKLKRPRTRRAEDFAESSSDATANDSNKRRKCGTETVATPRFSKSIANGAEGAGPSFLQSLLKEVETSVPADIDVPGKFRPGAIDYSSPRTALSPATSPPASDYATPRALSTTPPPQPRTRPQSPTPLTSKVEPIFPAPSFSPSRSPPPSRGNKSLSAKSDIERVVRAALNPYWQSNNISKEQFSNVNKSVSRMLYDKIADMTALDDKEKGKWEKLAVEEVRNAVEALKSSA
ncbi:MAG: PHD and RING finger domain-containing protein 1 [Geoglossum umbratile]|nr:MAG: PHD and RING finger domain-containing protein 1 [Geoglossum umbratile]